MRENPALDASRQRTVATSEYRSLATVDPGRALKTPTGGGIMPTVARAKPIDDFFSVPVGTVPAGEPEESFGISPVPAEAAKYRGKWLALRLGEIIAVRDTSAELRKEFGDRLTEVTFFHVPSTPNILR